MPLHDSGRASPASHGITPLGRSLALPTRRAPEFGRAMLLLSRACLCRPGRSLALGWRKVGIARLLHSFRFRCANSTAASFFFPPLVKGGWADERCAHEGAVLGAIDR